MTKSFKTEGATRVHRLIDAENRSLGRIASEAARFLQGKHSTTYMRHQDTGAFVEIKNLQNAKFTGHKLQQKIKYHYTGYPGGITHHTLTELWQRSPEFVLRVMVYHMLPTNSLRKKLIKRLTVK